MIYRNRFFNWIIFFSVPLIVGSCSHYDNKADKLNRIDTIDIDGVFFPDEELFIKANDSLVYYKKMNHLKKMKTVSDVFFLSKDDTVTLSIFTILNGKRYADTAFTIPPLVYINSIGGSICYPCNLSKDSLRSTKPNWQFLPIDSCKRYFMIMPDSIMHRYITY